MDWLDEGLSRFLFSISVLDFDLDGASSVEGQKGFCSTIEYILSYERSKKGE